MRADVPVKGPSTDQEIRRLKITEQQYRCMALVDQGLQTKQIAKILGISPDTVAYHIGNVMKTLGVGTRSEAARVLFPKVETVSSDQQTTTGLVIDRAKPERAALLLPIIRLVTAAAVAAYTLFSLNYVGPIIVKAVELLGLGSAGPR